MEAMLRRSLLLLATPLLLKAQGRDLALYYKFACATCHGQDGSARNWNGLRLEGRPLNDPRWQAKVTDAEMVKVIREGKRSMPAFKSQLSEAEAQRIVTELIRPMAARRK
jgi:mono/diheme cytochrome c family protein